MRHQHSTLFAAYSLLILLRPSTSNDRGACKVYNLADFLLSTTRSQSPLQRHYTPYSTPPGEGEGGLYIYAITQDCQLVFARWDQLAQFNELVEVDTRLNYCLPGLVQLHWRSLGYGDGTNNLEDTEAWRLGLQLLFKRSHHQVCTLPVEFPEENALAGPDLFSYSLRASLPYSSCSYTHSASRSYRRHYSPGNHSYFRLAAEFTLEPELSFMDSLYSDVIYFLDPHSSGPYWSVKQFQLDARGYFSHLGDFTVRNFALDEAEPDLGMAEQAKEYLLSLDLQRRRLYAVHRKRKLASITCAYDLLFRPHWVKVEQCSLKRGESVAGGQDWVERYTADHRINSVAVDGPLILFTELSRRVDDRLHTTLLMANRERNDSARCLLEVPYVARFGLIRARTLEELREVRLPSFRSTVQQRRKTHGAHKTPTLAPIPTRTAAPQSTLRPRVSSTTAVPTTSSTARKQTTRRPTPPAARKPPTTPSPKSKLHTTSKPSPAITVATSARPAVEDKPILLPVNSEDPSSIESTAESVPVVAENSSSSAENIRPSIFTVSSVLLMALWSQASR